MAVVLVGVTIASPVAEVGRVDAAGLRDGTFGVAGFADVGDGRADRNWVGQLAATPSGLLVYAGGVRRPGASPWEGATRLRVEAFTAAGAPVSSFGVNGAAEISLAPAVGDVVVGGLEGLPDGRVVVLVEFSGFPRSLPALVMFDEFGELDAGFGSGGVLVPPPPADCSWRSIRDVTLAVDGSLAVLTHSCNVEEVGLLSPVDGAPDPVFGDAGWITVGRRVPPFYSTAWEEILRMDAQRRVLLVQTGSVVKRFLPSGLEDPAFLTVPIPGDGNAYNTHAYANPADGSIVATLPYGLVKFYTADGSLDPSRPPFDNGIDAAEWGGYIDVQFGADGEMFAIGAADVVLLSPFGEEIADLSYDDVEGPPYKRMALLNGRLYRLDRDINDRIAISRPLLVNRGRVFSDVSPGHLFTPHPARPQVADPVNTASGALVMSHTDLSAPSGAPMLSWGRSYDSTRPASGWLGQGWVTSWDARVELRGDDVIYIDAAGAEYRFVADGNGGFLRPDLLFADAVVDQNGIELLFHDGRRFGFNTAGILQEMSDWTGTSVVVARGNDGRVLSLTSSTGASVAVTYTTTPSGDRIAEVAASDGRIVSYGYDATGEHLVSVDAPSGVTVYGYGDGRIVSETDGYGVVVHRSEYDTFGRVTRQELASGEQTLFAYDDAALTTSVTDVSSGDTVVYAFGPDAQLVSITDPAGDTTFTQWNADGQPTGSTNRLGHDPTATYDANGNLTSITDPVRGTTTYTYDSLNRVTSVTEPTGAVTTMTYDGSERLPSTVTDALGAVTTFDVVDGLVVSVADADGVITGYGYDAQRRMDAMTNGLGNTWTYTFDAVGRQIGSTTPLGYETSRTFDTAGRVLTSTAADGGITTYTYDTDGRVLTVTDPTGAVTTNTYDPVTGLLATTTDPAGRVTTYTYNATAELVAVTTNDGAVSETDYGTLGRVTATRDPLGRESTYAYDANGNRTEVVAPDGGVTRTEYDAAGRIAALEDPLGRRTVNIYDDFGRLISITRPDGTVMSYTYDLLGRQITTTAPDGGVTTTTFTPAGRTATVTDAEGGVTSYGYDAAGQTVTVTDPNGHTTVFAYDPDGRRTAVITTEGLVTTTDYDPVGRITKLIDPAGVEHTRSYTLRGELATEQREGDGVVSYTYNPDGTMASVADALGNTTSFTYDAAGRQATRVDTTGAVERWEYNPAGELVAQIDRLGQRTEIGYDTNGRIANVADPSGRTTTHLYNSAGELVERAFADGTTIGYSYDTMGRRVAMSDPTGVTTYNYDPNGRPIEVAAPNGTLGYSYDQAGRRTGLTYPDGTTVTYTYDPAGRLTGLTDPNTGNIDYTLDDDGRLVLTELPNGQTRQFDYVNGQMVRHQDHGRITDLTYDESGRIASLSGAQNHTYSYGPAGQLRQAVQDDGTYSYSYGPRGEITSITDPERSRTFTHNANTEIEGIVDNEGRTGDVTYDAAGRMTEHVDPDGTVTTYTYDARGLLAEVTVTEPGGTDPEIPYPEPVAGQPTTGTISPIFECWARETDGTYTAYWGYENRTTQNGQPVGRTIAHGTQNRLTPASLQGTQPTRFGVPGVVPGRPGRTAFGAEAPNAFVTRNWNGSNIVWNVAGRTATASITPSKQCASVPPSQTVTTETRTHDGDGTLTGLTNTQTGAASTINSLLWDPTTPVPNIAVIAAGAAPSNIVYGATRETLAGTPTSFTALGDQTTPSGALQPMTPYGPTTDPGVDIGFGYRSELQTLPGVHLRARTLLPALGVFHTVDPLDGVAGTTTYTNPYHYADNDPVGRIDSSGLRSTDASFGMSPTSPWEQAARHPESYTLDDPLGADFFEYSRSHGGYIPGYFDFGETIQFVNPPVFQGCYYLGGTGTDLVCGSEDVPDWALVSLRFDRVESGAIEGGGAGRALARLLQAGVRAEPFGGRGHHIIMKALFGGNTIYAPGGAVTRNRWALSLSDDTLKAIGTRHEEVTRFQQIHYRQYLRDHPGRQLTFQGVFRLETKALMDAGVEAGLARTIVRAGLDDLIARGITAPTRNPWSTGGPVL